MTDKRKDRKIPTPAEREEIMSTMQTAGHKGCKLPRINLAFSPANYDYIVAMSRARGETMTEFVNKVLTDHLEAHRDVYDKVIEFRNSL